MIKLLVSVKNAQEAVDAIEASADFIDLKDPSLGALGNLNTHDSIAIVQVLKAKAPDQQRTISATVGDRVESEAQLAWLIAQKIVQGVDIIKLPSEMAKHHLAWLTECIQQQNLKIIAVVFADVALDLASVAIFAKAGFFGVMLDTQQKQKSLLKSTCEEQLSTFIHLCKQHDMYCGLAGALRLQDIDVLAQFQPHYLGFRSAVCQDNARQNKLLPNLVKEIRDKLHKHNNI